MGDTCVYVGGMVDVIYIEMRVPQLVQVVSQEDHISCYRVLLLAKYYIKKKDWI